MNWRDIILPADHEMFEKLSPAEQQAMIDKLIGVPKRPVRPREMPEVAMLRNVAKSVTAKPRNKDDEAWQAAQLRQRMENDSLATSNAAAMAAIICCCNL